jgi:hypothetical protein
MVERWNSPTTSGASLSFVSSENSAAFAINGKKMYS